MATTSNVAVAEHENSNHHSASLIEHKVNVLRVKLSDAGDCSWKPDYDKKLDELIKWAKEQEENKQDCFEYVGKVLTATENSIEKFKSNDSLKITRAILDITSSVGALLDEPYSVVIKVLCIIIGTILAKSNHQQPSVVDQLAKLVHDELVHFNRRLQDQKYNGLKRRVSDQQSQLRTMKPGEKLDDPNLWNDYVQFMGELSNRFESPLPFKYEVNLTSDADVADFVSAVVIYCQAYCCFMALLIAVKGKFAELGSAYEQDEGAVNRKISCQMENAKKKLSFLSEERYLTFLGTLPYEGGKLTKIVVLSRITRSKSVIEAVRGSLGLTPMQDLATVEEAASKVARQSVKGKVKEHRVLPALTWKQVFREIFVDCYVQFINETSFPMKIVSGIVGLRRSNLKFVQDVQPHASYRHPCEPGRFSTGGYITLHMDGKLPNSDTKQPVENTRVIEFALSAWPELNLINIQDKTNDEFTYGQDTYNKMKCGTAKTLYWFQNGTHFMARGEIVPIRVNNMLARFVVHDFDPCSEQDLISIAQNKK